MIAGFSCRLSFCSTLLGVAVNKCRESAVYSGFTPLPLYFHCICLQCICLFAWLLEDRELTIKKKHRKGVQIRKQMTLYPRLSA